MKVSGDLRGCFPTGRHYPGIAHLLRLQVEGLASEWGPELAVSDIPWVSIDTETTGTDAATDRIIELGCVLMRGGEVIEQRGWLINPQCPIPQEASQVHGILDKDVADKPTFAELSQQVSEYLKGHLPLAYNAQFDRSFVHQEFARVAQGQGEDLAREQTDLAPALRKSVQWLDPLDWARELQKEHKSRALGEVCQRLGIELENAHRATDDAAAAGRVMAAFIQDQRVPRNYAALIKEQKRLSRLFEFERIRFG